jgi:hypothetical protein
VRLQGAASARVDPAPQAAARTHVEALWREVFGASWREAVAPEPKGDFG